MRIERTITAVDAHACGEPGRVIIGGVFDVPGETMFEKKNYLEQHGDWLRKLMLREPRGYPAACCNVLLPPTIEGAAAGYVIMEQTEYPPMSGTNTICVVTVLIETGMVEYTEPVTAMLLDTPAGPVQVQAAVRQGKVTGVTFQSVPAFAVHLDARVEVPQLGAVTVDVAYGGMFYVIAEAVPFGLLLLPDEARDIARIGEAIRAAAREQLPVAHPEICGVSISQLTAGAKNAVVVATGTGGALDRSPCGTGTCARMAVLHAKRKLKLNQDFVHEGILGTTFTGRLVEETRVGAYAAVVPELTGRAWITGYAQYVLDPSDPFPEGFTVGDIW